MQALCYTLQAMGKEGKKSTTITVRIPAALKKQVFAAMVRERRSLTNFVHCALEDRVAAGAKT